MTLISRITGMLQSRMLASYLGVGMAFDAFSVAYRVPNLLRRFTAEGTMTAAFLPTVSEIENTDGEEAAKRMVARFIGTFGLLLIFLCLVGMFFMSLFVGIQMLGRTAPDATWYQQILRLGGVFTGKYQVTPEHALTTTLARIMFPYLMLVSLTAGVSAVLNLKGRFGLPASVSTFWNLAFLGMGYIAFKVGPAAWREPVPATYIFAVAVLFGGVVQLFVLWPAFHSLGYRVRWGLYFKDPGVYRALRRMTPGLLGTGIHPINVVISMSLASYLAVGAQGVLLNSNMMGEMVLGLFSASLATVSLPTMSRLVDLGDEDGLRNALASALRGTAVMAIPASVGMAVLAQPIIALIFQTGRYNAAAVEWTARTLAFQAVGLLFIATGRIVTQCLYALKDYRTPAIAALLGMIANVYFSIKLMPHLGTGGIALANGLSSIVGLGLLSWSLRKRLSRPPWGRVLHGWLMMGLAATLMGILTWYVGRHISVYEFKGVFDSSLRLFPLMALAALVYFTLLFALRVSEARELMGLVQRKLLKR